MPGSGPQVILIQRKSRGRFTLKEAPPIEAVWGAAMRILLAVVCLVLVVVAIAVAGCDGEEAGTGTSPTAEPTSMPGSTSAITGTATPTWAESPAATPTVLPTSTPEATRSPGPSALFLEITSPEEDQVFETQTVLVEGKTLPDAVVTASVGDDLYFPTVAGDGTFCVEVTLVEGLNAIAVLASDWQDNEVDAVVTVVFLG